jgi:hypothetical protein
MNIIKRPNRKGDKITFYYDYGRGKGQRPSTGIFIYTRKEISAYGNWLLPYLSWCLSLAGYLSSSSVCLFPSLCFIHFLLWLPPVV